MDLNRLPSSSLAELDSDANSYYNELIKQFDGIGDVKSWMSDIYAYVPFDVLEFRKKIEQKISQEDLVFLVMMFLCNKMKITSAGQEKHQILTSKLNIKQSANGNNQVITLFRIAQSFPDVVAFILDKDPSIAEPLTLSQMKILSEYPEFPALAIQPLLACLLPRTHTQSLNILNVFLFSNMMLSETLNKKSELWGSKTKLQRATEIQTMQMNHFNSVIFNEDSRKEWCTRLKIMVDNEYSTVWIEAATKSKAKLMENYGISC